MGVHQGTIFVSVAFPIREGQGGTDVHGQHELLMARLID
jgi:hypothetical protein